YSHCNPGQALRVLNWNTSEVSSQPPALRSPSLRPARLLRRRSCAPRTGGFPTSRWVVEWGGGPESYLAPCPVSVPSPPAKQHVPAATNQQRRPLRHNDFQPFPRPPSWGSRAARLPRLLPARAEPRGHHLAGAWSVFEPPALVGDDLGSLPAKAPSRGEKLPIPTLVSDR